MLFFALLLSFKTNMYSQVCVNLKPDILTTSASLTTHTLSNNISIQNNGTCATTTGFKIGLYFSAVYIFDVSDYLIGKYDVTNTIDSSEIKSYVYSENLSNKFIPSGTYYLVVRIDSENDIVETSEGDNIIYIPGYNYIGSVNVSVGDVLENEWLKIFPNPVSNELFFTDHTESFSIIIKDIQGREVIKSQMNHNQSSINVSNIDSGVYILYVLDEKSHVVQTKKIIKN